MWPSFDLQHCCLFSQCKDGFGQILLPIQQIQMVNIVGVDFHYSCQVSSLPPIAIKTASQVFASSTAF
jgi:hypothetical protein